MNIAYLDTIEILSIDYYNTSFSVRYYLHHKFLNDFIIDLPSGFTPFVKMKDNLKGRTTIQSAVQTDNNNEIESILLERHNTGQLPTPRFHDRDSKTILLNYNGVNKFKI